MALTVEDLARRSMELLGALEAQEEPSAEDRAIFARTYANKYAELTARDLTYWELEEIPEEAFEAVCMVMADMNCSAYGKATPITVDENGQQVSFKVAGYRDLRRLMQKIGSGQVAQALYF